MPGKGELADAVWPGEVIWEKHERESGRLSHRDEDEAEADDEDEKQLAISAAAAARAEAAMMGRLADKMIEDASGSAVVLVGWSMGGMLAAELALALIARGHPPQMLHVAGRMAPGSFVAAGDDVDK